MIPCEPVAGSVTHAARGLLDRWSGYTEEEHRGEDGALRRAGRVLTQQR
jgi:hypothetical protein